MGATRRIMCQVRRAPPITTRGTHVVAGDGIVAVARREWLPLVVVSAIFAGYIVVRAVLLEGATQAGAANIALSFSAPRSSRTMPSWKPSPPRR